MPDNLAEAPARKAPRNVELEDLLERVGIDLDQVVKMANYKLYDGLVAGEDAAKVAAPKPAPVKVEKTKPVKPDKAHQKDPKTRVSMYGREFEASTEADWTEYPPVGWVHKTEERVFEAGYAQCAITKQWMSTTRMRWTFDNTMVDVDSARKVGWVDCAYSGLMIAPDDVILLKSEKGKPVPVSKGYMEKAGVKPDTCDFGGDSYVPGTLSNVKLSDRYKRVAIHELIMNKDVFQKCYDCGNWFEAVACPERARLNDRHYCARCYGKQMKADLIQKHDYNGYPQPIVPSYPNLGHDRKDGLIFATQKPVANLNKLRAARLFGVEIETEMNMKGCKKDGMDRVSLALSVKETLGDDFVMIKEDGTLLMNGKYNDGTDNGTHYAGFEIVSAAAPLDLHRKQWELLHKVEGFKHLRSWDTDTCGCHVHISRASLTSLQIWRILAFVNAEANQRFVMKVAGRSSCEYYKYKQYTPSEVLTIQPKRKQTRRWSINLTNAATVEFRIFRGTVNPRHIVRNVEFCDAVCDFCLPSSRSIAQLTDGIEPFLSFVSQHRKVWPMLAEWLALHELIPHKAVGEKADVAKMTLKPKDAPESELTRVDEPMRAIPQ